MGSGFVKNYIFIIFTLLLVAYVGLFIFNLISENKETNITKEKPQKNSVEKPEEKPNTNKNLNSDVRLSQSESTKKDDFKEAKKIYKDKSFIYIMKACLIKREVICSFLNHDYKNLQIKTLVIVTALINYIVVNTFFFSEKNIHQIYLDKNEYNFSYQFKYIISSLFISFIFISISKFFYSRNEGRHLLWKYTPTVIGACVISGILLIFYWLYIGAVTSLYINIKKHLIVNTVLCVIFSIIFEGLLSLISAALLYFAFQRDKGKWYKISKFMLQY